MDPFALDRRTFLARAGAGAAGLLFWRADGEPPRQPHFAARARRVLYLHMSGGPSQHDLFDHKPALARWHGQDLPDSVRQGQRITTMTSGQKRLRIANTRRVFAQRGECGAWISDLLPHTAQVVDELAIIRSMQTDAINHEPAINLLQTGSEQPGRPSFGAWLAWAIGSEAHDLPAFVVLHSTWTGPKVDQPLYHRLWGAGFLPAEHQGVLLRSQGDPVLFLNDPPGLSREQRQQQLAAMAALNGAARERFGDPGIAARQQQAELAFRMQAAVPELVDLGSEPAHVLRLYGDEVMTRGTFANNALLARRLLERGVRCVQIYHRGWDQHKDLEADLPRQCHDVDQATAALLDDLRQRGLLDDTLVVWTSEFGRTVYAQGELDDGSYGRDHHPRCFVTWLAGGGVRAGAQVGETDELGYNTVADAVHVHDLNATLLYLLGFDHEKLTFRFEGRDFRLTDVHGHVVRALLA
ncbi:MAG TPA: DUF1501 domain-containing protein [Planctomycetota bacterium]|nr:DUF1501 domain-containing protein [Planctomycetota bacterium]